MSYFSFPTHQGPGQLPQECLIPSEAQMFADPGPSSLPLCPPLPVPLSPHFAVYRFPFSLYTKSPRHIALHDGKEKESITFRKRQVNMGCDC